MSVIIDGKAVAAASEDRLRMETAELTSRGVLPCLAVIIVGSDPASQVYVRNKVRACERIGIRSVLIELPEETTEKQLLDRISELNSDRLVHGILVQLPLPRAIDKKSVITAIDPHKDVDCFSPENVGLIGKPEAVFLPCTPAGVIELIDSTGVPILGANCTVIGRSDLVGAPLARMLTARDGTVTLCHSKTRDIAFHAKNADILVSAVGRPGFVKAEWIKPGAVVIDVGTTRGDDGKLHGDVDFESTKDIAGFITPVPGGAGPMTIAKLMENAVRAAKNFG